MQGHVEAETVFLNSFFERQSGPRARLRRRSRAPQWLPNTPAQRSRAPKWLPSTPAQRPRAPKWLPSTPAQRLNSFFECQSGPRARLRRHSQAPKWLPSTPAQRSRAPKWLPSTPAQLFIEFLRVFSSQVAPAPRPRAAQTRPTPCRNERGYLYRYTCIYVIYVYK